MALLAIIIVVTLIILAMIGRASESEELNRARSDDKGERDPFDADNGEATPPCRVIRGRAHVVDGDTIVIKKTQIRLFGVDAPELNHPYGQKAKWALVSLCKRQTISAQVTAVDDHGRTVAKCYLSDGRDLSAEMVKKGMAIDWPKFSGGKYRTLELPNIRKKLWLADARQKGRLHVWKKFEAGQSSQQNSDLT